MIRYLTGASNAPVKAVAHECGIGLLIQPGNHYHLQVDAYPFWAADNGCFAQGTDFDSLAYVRWLADLPNKARCLFATAPDVLLRYERAGKTLVIGDAVATWHRSAPVLGMIRAQGFLAALVAQNGLRVYDGDLWAAVEYPDGRRDAVEVPWDAFDVLFLGGDNGFKFRPSTTTLVAEAKRRQKWVHMGRVNSRRRLVTAEMMGCDSADGTYLAFGPEKNLPNLLGWWDGLLPMESLATKEARMVEVQSERYELLKAWEAVWS